MKFGAAAPLEAVESPTITLWTDNQKFKFGVATKEVRLDSACGCYQYYEFYFQKRMEERVRRFKVNVFPQGAFDDGEENVRFEVRLDGVEDTGEARLTLASRSELRGLRLENRDRFPLEVELTGNEVPRVRVKNTLKSADLVITSIKFGSSIWVSSPRLKLPASLPARLAPDATMDLEFEAEPKLFIAIQRSLFKLGEKAEHAQVPLDINYANPSFQDRVGVLQEQVSVKFVPWAPLLPLVLVLGGILGSVLRFAAAGRSESWRPTTVAILTSVGLWCLGLLLVLGGSEFKILKIPLHPLDFIPTLLLGFVCGVLGLEALNVFRRAAGMEPLKAAAKKS